MNDRDEQRPLGPTLSQRLNVVLAVVIAVALVGFVIGIRAPTPPEIVPRRSASRAVAGVPPSKPYLALAARSRPATSQLERLRSGRPSAGKLYPTPTAAQRAAALAARAKRRAFDGAPPTIPHAIEQRDVRSCLTCHREGLKLGDTWAPRMSHDPRTNCTQCHVEATPRGKPTFVVENGFVGAETTGPGARAWMGAPPLMSHGSWMRERCTSCHGATARVGLRTPHPGRFNCQQCHAAAFSEFPR